MNTSRANNVRSQIFRRRQPRIRGAGHGYNKKPRGTGKSPLLKNSPPWKNQNAQQRPVNRNSGAGNPNFNGNWNPQISAGQTGLENFIATAGGQMWQNSGEVGPSAPMGQSGGQMWPNSMPSGTRAPKGPMGFGGSMGQPARPMMTNSAPRGPIVQTGGQMWANNAPTALGSQMIPNKGAGGIAGHSQAQIWNKSRPRGRGGHMGQPVSILNKGPGGRGGQMWPSNQQRPTQQIWSNNNVQLVQQPFSKNINNPPIQQKLPTNNQNFVTDDVDDQRYFNFSTENRPAQNMRPSASFDLTTPEFIPLDQDENDEEESFPQSTERNQEVVDKTVRTVEDYPYARDSCLIPNPTDSFHSITLSEIPAFDPELCNFTVRDWTSLINAARIRNGWENNKTLLVIKAKLIGKAKDFLKTMSSPAVNNFAEVLRRLEKTFTNATDFQHRLVIMLNRSRRRGESFIHYYEEKCFMMKNCDLSQKDALYCVLQGLEHKEAEKLARQRYREHIRDMDTARNLMTFLDSTIKEGLSDNEEIKCDMCEKGEHLKQFCSKRKRTMRKDEDDEENGQNKQQQGDPKRKKKGYILNDSFKSTKGSGSQFCENNVMFGVLGLKPIRWDYFKDVLLNERQFQGYVDVDSCCTTIREDVAQSLNLRKEMNADMIQGFAGMTLQCLGAVQLRVTVDKASADVIAYVIPNTVQKIPVVVGEDFAKAPHVVIFKGDGCIEFYEN